MADVIYSPGRGFLSAGVVSGVMFAELSDLEDLAIEMAGLASRELNGLVLVAHNGDHVASVACYSELVRVIGSVYSVNVNSSLEAVGVRPLPIGLENRHHDRVGRLGYFPSPAEFTGTLNGRNRTITVLASFRTSTNPAIREPLKNAAIANGALWLEPGRDNERYFDAVRQSTFVLSPPGNGPDCHRTWEAIYLGAVPVVLESATNEELAADLPILRVRSYEEFLGLSWDEKLTLAEPLRGMRPAKAYMPYWCSRLISGP